MRRLDEPLLRLPAFAAARGSERLCLLRHTDLVPLPAGQSVLTTPGPRREMLIVTRGTFEELTPARRRAVPGALLGAHGLLSARQPAPGYRALAEAEVAVVGIAQARVLLTRSPLFATAVAVALADELDGVLARSS